MSTLKFDMVGPYAVACASDDARIGHNFFKEHGYIFCTYCDFMSCSDTVARLADLFAEARIARGARQSEPWAWLGVSTGFNAKFPM